MTNLSGTPPPGARTISDAQITELTRYTADKNWTDEGPRIPFPKNLGRELLIILLTNVVESQLLAMRLAAAQAEAAAAWRRDLPATLAGAAVFGAAYHYIERTSPVDLGVVRRMMVELANIADGRQRGRHGFLPPLKATSKSGRPEMALEQLLRKQVVAVSVSILMDEGFSERRAIAFVQKRLTEIGSRIPTGTIRSWRASVMALSSFGRPGQLDRNIPKDPGIQMQAYARFWLLWRSMKKPADASTVVAGLLHSLRRLDQKS